MEIVVGLVFVIAVCCSLWRSWKLDDEDRVQTKTAKGKGKKQRR